MDKEQVIKGANFDRVDYKETMLAAGEYEQCSFANCDFSNADLSGIVFVNCEFTGCNLSLAKLARTVLREIKFVHCKMLSLRFDNCSSFGMSFSFEHCILNHSSFYQLKLKATAFRNTQMHETDLSQCDLTSALFEQCDLSGTTFDRTILEKADLSTAYSYSIDPENNRIKKAKFAMPELVGLLHKYDVNIV